MHLALSKLSRANVKTTRACSVMVFVIVRFIAVLKLWHGCVVPDVSSVAAIYTEYSTGTVDHGTPVPEHYHNDSDIA